jgi:hypothetical protein
VTKKIPVKTTQRSPVILKKNTRQGWLDVGYKPIIGWLTKSCLKEEEEEKYYNNDLIN